MNKKVGLEMKNMITTIFLFALLITLSGFDQQEEMSIHYSGRTPFTSQELANQHIKITSIDLVSEIDGSSRNITE